MLHYGKKSYKSSRHKLSSRNINRKSPKARKGDKNRSYQNQNFQYCLSLLSAAVINSISKRKLGRKDFISFHDANIIVRY